MTTRMTRFALILPLLLAGAPVAAQDFSPAVVVNDEIVTGYDIQQRQRLLQAASGGGGQVSEKQATEQLIDDVLRLQAARRAGIVPTKEDIDAGFADLSRSQGREPETMRRYFRSQGVSDRHLDRQIAAEVAWRELIPRAYMPRIRISDAEVREAMGESSAPTEPEYLLSEIRLPIGAGGADTALSDARLLLQRLRTGGVTFGDLARERSSGLSAASGGDLGWVPLSAMSPAMRETVAPMSKDRVSTPFVDGNEVVIVGVRRTRGPGGIVPASYRLSQIVVGVAPDAAPATASAALQQAQAAKARVSDCGSVEAIKGDYLPISGDIGTLTPDQMPGPVRQAVATLPVGGISDPIRSNDGFHIIVVCDRVENATAEAGSDERSMRRRLTGAKLDRYSTSLLRKLRREAVIERR